MAMTVVAEALTRELVGALWRNKMEGFFIRIFRVQIFRVQNQPAEILSEISRVQNQQTDYGSQNQQAEILSEISIVQNQQADYGSQNQRAEILSEISRVQNQQADYGSQNQPAEILSEISRVQNQQADYGSQNQQAEILSKISRVQNQQAEISNQQAETAETLNRIVNWICTLQNRQEIYSKEGPLSEPGKMDIKMNIMNPVLPNPGWKDRFSMMKMEGSSKDRFSMMKMEGSSKDRFSMMQMEGSSKDRFSMMKMEGSSKYRFSMMQMEGFSIQQRSQNQQADILSKEGLLSEPVNIDAANACVLTRRRKLQPDEITAAKLYKENVPSVVFITNIALRKHVFIYERGYGTGFIWDRKGHIVTNYHVIQDAYVLRVTLGDRSEYAAKVIGYDQDKDVAVLGIGAPVDKLRPVAVGSLRGISPGHKVYAIGSPFGLVGTLTTGSISYVERGINSATTGRPILVIQTDAAINPGNSGGPLFDSSGFLIGINTAIHSPSGASAGVAFSIPVDTVRGIVDQWVDT